MFEILEDETKSQRKEPCAAERDESSVRQEEKRIVTIGIRPAEEVESTGCCGVAECGKKN
jgi:hypothetical protein